MGIAVSLVWLAGCAVDAAEQDVADESVASADALTEVVADGSTAVTTASLRLRQGPSTSTATLDILARGTTVTIVDGRPRNGFYAVEVDGEEGYCHGNYLRLSGTGGTNNGGGANDDDRSPGDARGDSFTARGTGYYPSSSAMEGGFVDRRGARLRTLQQYLAGSAEYVSVAMDSNAFAYGTKLRIRELEEKYNRVIEFRVVDTSGAFRGKGRSRIDICTANRAASLDSTINGTLHITVDN